jgi:hypothetical protein
MADKKKKLFRDVVTLDHWIEVTTCRGETVTEVYPSNEQLREKLAHMSPPPDLIYRRIHFRGGECECETCVGNRARLERKGVEAP